MSVDGPIIHELDMEERDMHYHCECCGATSAQPGVCTTSDCDCKGEEMELCRKTECAPGE